MNNKKRRKKKKKKPVKKFNWLFLLVICVAVGAFAFFKLNSGKGGGGTNATVNTKHSYVVSTSNETATMVGEKVLAEGGNAVDAAVAVAYALGVAQPYASGIGGGGGMLVYDPAQDNYQFYDYRETSPLSATQSGAVGVPGFVLGMETVSKDLGTMDIADLIQYSIDLAENGVDVNIDTEKAINSFSTLLQYDEDYLNNGVLLKKGDTLVQKELANTLRKIQAEGSSAFYSGEIAQSIAASGAMQVSDLQAYKVDKNAPVKGEFNGYEVVSAPPPFSGTTLVQMLEIIEEKAKTTDISTTDGYLSVLDSATTLSSYDRVKKLADLNFVSTDYQAMTSDEYIQKLIQTKDPNYTEDDESESTTHFVIVDKDGMVVSSTNTLGHFFGSQQKVDGFYLNGSIKNFSPRGINKYAPGKRSRTYSSPTIIKKGDEYIMGIGSPGGIRIVKMLVPILVDELYFKKDLQESINKLRVIFYEPGVLMLEASENQNYIIDALNSSYSYFFTKDELYFGAVQAGGISNGNYFGATDSRRVGKVSISNR